MHNDARALLPSATYNVRIMFIFGFTYLEYKNARVSFDISTENRQGRRYEGRAQRHNARSIVTVTARRRGVIQDHILNVTIDDSR